jgi:hypothetical protein
VPDPSAGDWSGATVPWPLGSVAAASRPDVTSASQSRPVQYRPVQSSPVQSGPVQSSPAQSSPVRSGLVQSSRGLDFARWRKTFKFHRGSTTNSMTGLFRAGDFGGPVLSGDSSGGISHFLGSHPPRKYIRKYSVQSNPVQSGPVQSSPAQPSPVRSGPVRSGPVQSSA